MRTERPRGHKGGLGAGTRARMAFSLRGALHKAHVRSRRDSFLAGSRAFCSASIRQVAGLSHEANDCQTDARNDDWPGRFGMNKRIPHATSPVEGRFLRCRDARVMHVSVGVIEKALQIRAFSVAGL
jgi:hypothetical protein